MSKDNVVSIINVYANTLGCREHKKDIMLCISSINRKDIDNFYLSKEQAKELLQIIAKKIKEVENDI